MRIIHLGKYYPPSAGGIEAHTRTLARAQAIEGADVTVVVVNHRGADGRDATFRATTRTASVVEEDGPVRVVRVGRLVNVARFDLAPDLAGVLRRLSRERPDVWHVHTPNPTMLLALAGDAAQKTLVVTHHSDVVRQRLLRLALAPFERIVYARAARLFADSPPYVEGSAVLRRWREKVVVLPLGIELAPFLEPSPAATRAANDARAAHAGPIWLCVGRLIYYKAIDVALRALREVEGSLVVVGTGPMESAWRRLAAELGLADRVTWAGASSFDELVGLYRAATALWFPSHVRSEAFGLVQVEAMASGCPVINAAIPDSGVSWVSRHDESGLTVPVDDAPALAAAARRLQEDGMLRGRLATGARRAAVERFDDRTMARASLALYADAIGRRPCAPRSPRARVPRALAPAVASATGPPWAS